MTPPPVSHTSSPKCRLHPHLRRGDPAVAVLVEQSVGLTRELVGLQAMPCLVAGGALPLLAARKRRRHLPAIRDPVVAMDVGRGGRRDPVVGIKDDNDGEAASAMGDAATWI
ncbi:hypothetical protein E2562_019912 [Oryza meyeriana var. granulata]|uniref:Uncharacterized protein n=1 Tax=Oryza meyeriana var. granulata TaxID=110450 RepID=A0A6G1EXF4_9ORYZ|nr:hypothetical protein E2562_019912 [Oryza meyeriana var. granulata]